MSTTPLAAGRRATITDVAREAGTGKTSISRYLNGELSVLSPELRARIEAAIERLDYQPNQMARGLKRGRNRLIGMLLADLTNPYTVEVLQGVEAACHALGLMPLICHAANEVEMERRYLQLLTTYRVEGVIVNALGVREETLRPVGGGGIPAVLVDRSVDGLVADMVGLDNRAAAELGTRHLLENGFDEIWFVVQPFEQVSSRQLREAAFREMMRGEGGRAGGQSEGGTDRGNGAGGKGGARGRTLVLN
ncbi:MAG: LacI family transcriptional regulator, kdg operon repressor, partial [Paraburkholderia sp.]|nr:LacI family transcriptional regulator, kdg operon repressor [Paraburkholderia sp.]